MQAGAVNEQETLWCMAVRNAPHGHKQPVVAQACAALGIQPATLYRRIQQLVAVHKPRKRRSDAGKTALTHAEALDIALTLREHRRNAGQKAMLSLRQTLAMLRANGTIRAERIDRETGEVIELSESTIWRALKTHHLHHDQLSQPAPVMPLRSLHPNHLWQIDASRCVLYYLPSAGEKARGASGLSIKTAKPGGLEPMDVEAFNKNKPANVMKAMNAALWRYVITDHASGWLYTHYVTGGESAANVIEAFIGAMQQRAGQALHGVPKMVMLDPGGANVSAAFINLCHALGVYVQINAKGNPRGKGQVEKGQDIVERQFESRLRTVPKREVSTLAQINTLGGRWVRAFNATAVHSRHGMTRDAAWLKITPDQLTTAPDAALLRQLAASKPEARKVNPDLTVSFDGKTWNVKEVPGVLVGQTLLICRNAFDAGSVQALGEFSEGVQTFHVLPQVLFNEWGQRLDAPVVGESYKRHAETPAQTNLKAMERRAMDAASDDEAAQKRKAGAPLMGGRFDAFADIARVEKTLATPLPRRGQVHGLDALQPVPVIEEAPLTHYLAAKRLSGQFDGWSAAHYDHLRRLYPGGVAEAELDDAATAIAAAMQPVHFPATAAAPRLRAVG